MSQTATSGRLSRLVGAVFSGHVPSVTGAYSDLEGLLDLCEAPAWQADAACREHPEVSWFPNRGQPSEPAKAICADCLVRQECLAYALDIEQTALLPGIWGGLSSRQRRDLRGQAVAEPSSRGRAGSDTPPSDPVYAADGVGRSRPTPADSISVLPASVDHPPHALPIPEPAPGDDVAGAVHRAGGGFLVDEPKATAGVGREGVTIEAHR